MPRQGPRRKASLKTVCVWNMQLHNLSLRGFLADFMKCQALLMVSDSFPKLRLFVWTIFQSWWAKVRLLSTYPPPLPCQPACVWLRLFFFFCGTEDYQSESASERNNGWVIFRASCFSSEHCRHKQWSSQWLQSCSGSNKSVLYFLFLCWLAGSKRVEKIGYGRAYSVVLYFIFEEKLLIEKER